MFRAINCHYDLCFRARFARLRSPGIRTGQAKNIRILQGESPGLSTVTNICASAQDFGGVDQKTRSAGDRRNFALQKKQIEYKSILEKCQICGVTYRRKDLE